MKNLYLTIFSLLLALNALAQTATVVDPPGLVAPYEVTPGTEVTVQFDFFGDSPTVLMHDEEPDMSGFGLNPDWNTSTSTIDNGDGTFNYTFTAEEEVWVWGGIYAPFIMNWTFSNVLHFVIVSDVSVNFDDGVVCGDGVDTEVLSVEDIYEGYQWYLNNEPIEGANDATYPAVEAGNYKIQVLDEGAWVFSGTVNISEPVINMTGSYIQSEMTVTITADAGFDSYQWWSGPSGNELTIIEGVTGQSYAAPITADEIYYAVSGTIGTCTITADAVAVSADIFTAPTIDMDATTNTAGEVCAGSTVILSVEGDYENYEWSLDGAWYGDMPQLYIFSSSEAGAYTISVSPIGWPGVTLESAPLNLSFVNIVAPELVTTGTGPYCPGDEITVLLGDEGYDYNWYLHSSFDYSEEDLVDVEGISYSFTFEEQIYLTVEAAHDGCVVSSTLNFFSAADTYLPVSLVNWDQQYLCTDSVAYLEVPEWDAANFSNFQWYQQEGEDWIEIDGATDVIFGASETGIYAVEADVNACSDVSVMSDPMEIQSYADRDLFIFAENELLCMGEEAELHISDGDAWMQIQWFERQIEMGATGYEEVYIPLITGGNLPTQTVTEFNYYQAKARHESCPTGVKVSSNAVSIRPLVNPEITVNPDYGVVSVRPAPYGEIRDYVYCSEEPVQLSVPDQYESYSWHATMYAGDDDYQLGEPIAGEEDATTTFIATGADWLTAQVDSAGCIGVSDPVLINTWVFLSPAIASYNNSEICEPGDSTLIHIAFEGNYETIEWYYYNNLIPDAEDDSLWVTEPGTYTVTIYPEECPEFGFTSGVGPTVTFLDPYIVEEEDLIYAMPHEGFYEFQWYLDGEPIDAPVDTPWILYKADMPNGEYTVEVTNPEPCSAISAPFYWFSSGVEDDYQSMLEIYPNPTNGELNISGIDMAEVASVRVVDYSGNHIHSVDVSANRLQLGHLAAGMYVVEITTKEGTVIRRKVLKN